MSCLTIPFPGYTSSICAGDAAAPKEKVAVDLHLVILADKDGAYVVLVP